VGGENISRWMEGRRVTVAGMAGGGEEDKAVERLGKRVGGVQMSMTCVPMVTRDM
jgi:hypothetical protein